MTALPIDDRPNDARDLSESERLLHFIHTAGALIATTTLRVRGPLTEALLRRALDWLQRRHPLLGAHIRWRGYGFSRSFPAMYRRMVFETAGTTEIPLRMIEGDWQAELQRQLRTPMRRNRSPRMRATAVSESADLHHIILACDHTIGDAQAAFAAMRDLMTFLADPDAVPRPNDARLPPPLESGHRKSTNPAHYEPAIRLPHQRLGEPVETRFEKRTLDVAATEVLRQSTRQRRTTINGAVSAAILSAAGARFGMDKLTCLTNAEFRRLMQPPLPNETFGCYIDVLRTTHDLDQSFWSLAREISFKLVTAVARHQHESSVLRLWDANGYRHEMIPTVQSGYCLDGIAVTTGGEAGVGRDYGPFTLEDVTLCTSLNPVGIGLYVAAIELGGSLQLTLCYGSRRLRTEDVAGIADAAIAILGKLPAD